MLARSFLEMVHLALNSNRLNLHVLFLTKMEFAIQEELMVASMFGIKNRISDLSLRLIPLKSLVLPVTKEFLSQLAKMTWFQSSLVIKVNINS